MSESKIIILVHQQERIIPIQMEQSPIKTPASAPSFAPPPYYSPGPQYNTVQSPLTVGYPGPHSGNASGYKVLLLANHTTYTLLQALQHQPRCTATQITSSIRAITTSTTRLHHLSIPCINSITSTINSNRHQCSNSNNISK